MRRFWLFGGLLLLLTILVLPAGAKEEKEKAKEPVFKTPEAVFDAFLTATTKQDRQTIIHCYSPELQMDQAASLAASALNQQHAAQGDSELSKQIRKDYQGVLEALDKYGLKYEVTKDIKTVLTPEGKKKTQAELTKLIKDPVGLWIALSAGYEKAGPGRKQLPEIKGTLTEFKIDGDKAKAVAVITVGNAGEREIKLPIEFAKKGEGWKISKVPEGPG